MGTVSKHTAMRQTDSGSFVEEMVSQIERGTVEKIEKNLPKIRCG